MFYFCFLHRFIKLNKISREKESLLKFQNLYLIYIFMELLTRLSNSMSRVKKSLLKFQNLHLTNILYFIYIFGTEL